jgi:hypothetical protein
MTLFFTEYLSVCAQVWTRTWVPNLVPARNFPAVVHVNKYVHIEQQSNKIY